MQIMYRFIMWYMKRELRLLRKTQDTPYIYIKGTGKDYPNYLVFTDDKNYRNKLHYLQELE